ncbi:MAG TPA: 6-pyruvoyl-tetrahydropterin synthase-related protein [Phototrophicaceae bacterium]|nr:6-pyruvoyl-tetrahydropterin synthase-related protein [Phototrophicaceae bacterium]
MAQLTTQRDHLPLWMQKTLRGTDWGVLLVLAFSLVAAWPFLLQPGLPLTNAGEHYVYRSADYAQAFAEGRLYPRWSPNALTGYGAPIPNYYPPGAAYVPAVLDMFLTNDATLAVKLVYALALCLAGVAVYTFVTRRSGAATGVIAALLYIYSPYVGLTAPYLLGDLPGVICLMLIPALLWSIDRLLHLDQPLDILFVAAITAALLLTDVPAAIVAWTLAAALLAANTGAYARWYLIIGAGMIGVALAGCFWLPAFFEADAVQWFARPLAIPQQLTLLELLTPLSPVDPGALIPAPQFALGLTLVAFIPASFPMIARRRLGFHALFLLLGLALTALTLTVFSSEVWLLGPITLCFAVASSAVIHWIKMQVFLPLLTALILIVAAPIWLAPRWSQTPIDTSPQAQVEYEQQGFGIAVLPDGEPLPSTIAPTTAPNRALIASYGDGLVSKIAQDSNLQIGILEHDSHGDQFQVQTFAPLTLRILTAYFPGWAATFNGVPIPLVPGDDGLITLNLDNGARGDLAISLESTPPRLLGWSVSWLALLLLITVTILRLRRSRDRYEPLDLLPVTQARLLALVGVGFVVVLALTALPIAPLPLQAQTNYELAGTVPFDDSSDSGLEVMAYHLDNTVYHPGDTIHLTLYWQTLRFLPSNYSDRLSLLNLSDHTYVEPSDLTVPGGYPTLRWLPRYYVSDPHTIALPSNFPPGTYSPALEVCSSECTPEDRVTFFSSSGSSSQVLVLPTILHVS